MRRGLFSTACVAVIVMCTSVVGGQGKSGGPKLKSGAAAQSGRPVTHGGAKTTRTGTTTTVKSGHGKGGAKTTTAAAPKHARTTTITTTTTTTGVTLTPVQQKLQRNTKLAQKLQSRLPAGTDMNAAAAGFRNLGQFVAAVNVSNNLGLDFPTLKTAMVDDRKSLGQAIQAQRQSADATLQAGKAQREADALIQSTDSSASKKPAKAKTRPSGKA